MARLVASSTASVRSDVAHLLRRSGFGATPDRVVALAEGGYDAAVEEVIGGLTAADAGADAVADPTFDTVGYLALVRGDPAAKKRGLFQARAERQAMVAWWVHRMVLAEHPLREKLTFLWHDHFATSLTKVRIPERLFTQRNTIHQLGAGRFDALLRALAIDRAMLVWLDGRDSTAAAPNENFAREMLELFTLGHGSDHHGGQPYTEQDVHELARSLTGWTIGTSGAAGILQPDRHDQGTKTVLGTTGPLGLDEVVQIATGHASCAPHVVSRLWSRLAYPADVDDSVVRQLASGFADDLDITALLRAMFLHPAFLSDDARTGLVRMPIDFVVGTLRVLQLTLPDGQLLGTLQGLAQMPFVPPDVSGWPKNETWLSTSSAQARIAFANQVAAQADLSAVNDTAAADRPDALASLLSLDGWNDATASAIADAPDGRRALVIALVSPEHLVA